MTTLKLFHATNQGAADKAFLHGLGIGKDHYEGIATLIAAQYPVVSPQELMRYFDCDSSEANHGVSFMPSKQRCIQMAPSYANGGEWLNLFLKQALKLVARRLKVPYQELDNKELRLALLGPARPVVIEALVPVELIANSHHIGKGTELYTTQKVPPECLVRVWQVLQ